MENAQSEKVADGSDVSVEVKDGSGTDGVSDREARWVSERANETSAGGTSRSKRQGSSGGQSRFGHRRSPTTGHRVRRHKTPEPNFVPPPQLDENQKKKDGKRSLSSPRVQRRISSSEEEEDERRPRRISKTKTNDTNKTKLEASKRWSGMTLTSADVGNEVTSKNVAPKPVLRTRSKSRGHDEKEDKEGEKSSWWKSWPSWTQRIRGKSLEREPGGEAPLVVPPRRNRSLERPPVMKEKEKRAAARQEEVPVAKKRSKSKTRYVSEVQRQPSVEDSSDDFWKSSDGLRKRNFEEQKTEEVIESLEASSVEEASVNDNSQKELVLLEGSSLTSQEEPFLLEKIQDVKKEPFERFSLLESYREIRSEWESFIRTNSREVRTIRISMNHCLSCFVILVMYCGTGALVFRFTEGAFESFYKCGVKRVKREFVDGLWLSSHNLREEEWKSLARRKLMEFEEQLHTAYEAGMMSYSGLKAWSFLNAFVYCLTVVTTIGYGHISPSTTTGRAITIVYAIFGIPMFLILLADFGKLFTRGIKFVWAFVRRVYYTGSCKKVRRTVPVQSLRSSTNHVEYSPVPQTDCPEGEESSEMMKGVQMVYDIATFRRPSQLPPGVTLDEAAPPPLPPRVYTPGEPPGTPALSTYAIDDEFNLPISVAIFILLIYIICGATVFYMWENWGFFESFYFVFISMSTIGFGDFVPQGMIDSPFGRSKGDTRTLIDPNQMYMMASIVYLVFGLALTSMCINVVQEKLSDSFRQASAKIGATIGLRVAEEDGAVTPVAPAPVELPQVHGGGRGTASTPPTTSAAVS